LKEELRIMQFKKVIESLAPVLQESLLIGCDLLVTDKTPIGSVCTGYPFAKNPYGLSSIMIADERGLVVISQGEDGTFMIHDFVKILDYHKFHETLIPQHTQLYEKVEKILEELGETEEIFFSKLIR
jgi:hypothetical protein